MYFMSVCKDQISQCMRLPPFHTQQFKQQYKNSSIISRHKKDNSMSSPTKSGIFHYLNFRICMKKQQQMLFKNTD